MRHQDRQSNPLFEEFLPAVTPAGMQHQQPQTAESAGAGVDTQGDTQEEILKLLESVVGRMLDAHQPLMEVQLAIPIIECPCWLPSQSMGILCTSVLP